MLDRLRNRATGAPEGFEAPEALLVGRRHDWEAGLPGWKGPLLVDAADWVIAADASLYYQADLRRRLAPHVRVDPDAATGELLLAALRTWGDRFARHVEGDYAIVAYDKVRRRVIASRDFGGRRALVFAVTPDRTLVIASSPNAVVEFPDVPRTYDLDFIAAAASGLFDNGERTAYAAVKAVAAGATMAFAGGRFTNVDRYELPPFDAGWEDATPADCAEQLRTLVQEAALERLPHTGVATVLMSGGWDSTSVFCAASDAVQRRRPGLELRPVSIRYPEGDRGREDEYVIAVAARWNAPVRWIDADEIRLLEDAERRAEVRDDPRIQQFEGMMRALSRATREMDARVSLDGFGGDQLFSVSSGSVLADHFFYGRWIRLLKDMRPWGRSAPKAFAEHCLIPYLSREMLDLIGTVVGRHVSAPGDGAAPPWIVQTDGVRQQTLSAFPRHVGEGAAARESRSGMLNSLLARAVSWNHAITLEEGIQTRSPLFDLRVIEFATARPLSDRGGGPNSKIILRRAMEGLVPAEVLETRTVKTGTTVDYFRKQFREAGPNELRHFFGQAPSRLERLGVVNGPSLRRAIARYETSGGHALGVALHLTLEAERWLAIRAFES